MTGNSLISLPEMRRLCELLVGGLCHAGFVESWNCSPLTCLNLPSIYTWRPCRRCCCCCVFSLFSDFFFCSCPLSSLTLDCYSVPGFVLSLNTLKDKPRSSCVSFYFLNTMLQLSSSQHFQVEGTGSQFHLSLYQFDTVPKTLQPELQNLPGKVSRFQGYSKSCRQRGYS